MALFAAILAFVQTPEALRTRYGAVTDNQSVAHEPSTGVHTFEQFVQVFGRTYMPGGEEYARRESIFQSSLTQISLKNSRSNRSWTAGTHPFMDWTVSEREERLYGYAPSSPHATRLDVLASLQASVEVDGDEQVYGGADDSFEAQTPEVRNQGALCGSCWAFSAVEAVEALLMKAESPWRHHQVEKEVGDVRLSPQALLDCVPNPRHCGGKGGCYGGTGDLAFAYMRDHGIPLENDLQYHPGKVGKCPMEPYPSGLARVVLTGWRSLPTNKAQPLMHALVNDGPLVVSVDAHEWVDYDSGVFDGCNRDAVLNHAVLAKGYGRAQGSEAAHRKKYWLIQNSWGARWGEDGNVRLFRHDDEDQWCGTDHHPQEGDGCDGGAQAVAVCGSCGVLFRPLQPQGATFILPSESGGGGPGGGSAGVATTETQDSSAWDMQDGSPTVVTTEAQDTSASDMQEPSRSQELIGLRANVGETPPVASVETPATAPAEVSSASAYEQMSDLFHLS